MHASLKCENERKERALSEGFLVYWGKVTCYLKARLLKIKMEDKMAAIVGRELDDT